MWLPALIAVASAAGVQAPGPSSDDVRPRAVVYGYPSSTAAMLGLGSSGSDPTLYGALGMSVRLSSQVGLDAELAGGSLNARDSQTGWLFSIGAGPSVQLTGDDPFQGLFIATRVRLEAFLPPYFVHPTATSVVLVEPGIARSVLGEIDVGYHFRFRRLYIAPIIGFGVGYSYDYIDSTHVGMLSPFTSAPDRPGFHPQGIVWTVNLNLARIGLAI